MAAPSRSIRGPGARTGSSSGAAIQVEGLKEFRRELRRLEEPKGWTKDLSAIHRSLAKDIAGKAQAEAQSMGGIQKHFAGAIRGYGTVTAARIGVSSAGKGQKNWGANVAYWGVKDNISGWNRSRNPNLKAEWVGNTWDVGRSGQGPYAINETIARYQGYIVHEYGTAVGLLTRRAFPD